MAQRQSHSLLQAAQKLAELSRRDLAANPRVDAGAKLTSRMGKGIPRRGYFPMTTNAPNRGSVTGSLASFMPTGGGGVTGFIGKRTGWPS